MSSVIDLTRIAEAKAATIPKVCCGMCGHTRLAHRGGRQCVIVDCRCLRFSADTPQPDGQ